MNKERFSTEEGPVLPESGEMSADSGPEMSETDLESAIEGEKDKITSFAEEISSESDKLVEGDLTPVESDLLATDLEGKMKDWERRIDQDYGEGGILLRWGLGMGGPALAIPALDILAKYGVRSARQEDLLIALGIGAAGALIGHATAKIIKWKETRKLNKFKSETSL